MAEGSTLINVEENVRKIKRAKRKALQTSLDDELRDLLRCSPPTPSSLEQFSQLLEDARWGELEELVDQMKTWDILTTIPEPKSFLWNTRFQLLLADMLSDIAKNERYVELFVVRFHAENELVAPKQSTKEQDSTSHRTRAQHSCGNIDAPIHFAAMQLHQGFFEWLLARERTEVNLRNSFKQTALAILCEKYDECIRTVKDPADRSRQLELIRTLIERLLQAGANFNICSIRLKLPIELLLKHSATDEEARKFLEKCVEQAGYALVVCRAEYEGRSVGFLNNDPNVRITVELFEIFLRYNNGSLFDRYWPSFSITKENVKKVIKLLLHSTLDQKQPECFRLIVDKGSKVIFELVDGGPKGGRSANVNVNRVELKGLLKKACLMADLGILQLLVSKITDLILLNEDPLLALTLARAHDAKRRSEERSALVACAEYLANNQTIYMSKVDNSGNTPLHLALKYGFDSVALALLNQRYAYLGQRNRDNLTPLDYGTYEFWKTYLDRCIEVEADRGSDQKVVRFNLNCFEPFHHGKAAFLAGNKSNANSRSWKFVQAATSANHQPRKYARTVTEMTTVRQIAQSKELKPLLVHPVVHTLIMVKWMRLSHWNYLNLVLTVLTAVFFGSYSLTACSRAGPNRALGVLSATGAALLAGRELLQFLFLRKSYFSFENTLDIANVVGMLIVLVNGCNGLLSSFVVISLAMQVTFLFGSLPFNSLSTMMYMFKTVSKNFLKSLLLFIPLISAFIFAFYLTNNESPDEVDARDACTEDDCVEKNFNNFHTIWNATIKTLVMTTGEFEAAAFDFTDGKVFLFIVFMFVAPIVILNLINGLAVSDIAAIREESELISIGKKVMLLEQYERGVANVRPAWIRKLFPRPFFCEYNCWIHVKAKEFRKIEVHTREEQVKSGPPVRGKAVKADVASNQRRQKPVFTPISVFPWLGNNCSDVFLNFRFFKLTLFMRLDQSILTEALAINERRYPFAAGQLGTATTLPTLMTTIVEQPTPTPSPAAAPAAVKRVGGFEQANVRKELQELKGQMAAVLELLRDKKKRGKRDVKQKGLKRKDRKRLRLGLKKTLAGYDSED